MEKYANSKERKALSSFIHQNLIKMTVQTQPKSTKEKKIFGWFIRSGLKVGKVSTMPEHRQKADYMCVLYVVYCACYSWKIRLVYINVKERFIKQATTVDDFHGMNNQMNDLQYTKFKCVNFEVNRDLPFS